MRKNKIEVCELAATTDSNKTSEENLNKQDNISVDNTDEQSFKMLLKDGAIVKSSVTLTVYNWQFLDLNECLVYSIISHI